MGPARLLTDKLVARSWGRHGAAQEVPGGWHYPRCCKVFNGLQFDYTAGGVKSHFLDPKRAKDRIMMQVYGVQ